MALEERIERLESKLALVITIADHKNYPFICTCLEAGMDTTQIDRVLELITKAENALQKTPMSYSQFEKELQEIVPLKKGNPQFTKEIIKALNVEDKFILVAKNFKRQGITF
jgi:hypothetical protein